MAVEHALRELSEHWDDVMSRLDEPERERLRAAIDGLGGPGHDDAANGLADLLTEELPRDHPVRRALSSGNLFHRATADWTALKLNLRDVVTPGYHDPILADVLARLLRDPALTEDEVRLRGADPADPALIRLTRPEGGRRWPAFQFTPGGGPLPVVRTVNEVLGAERDPVGAADWWLGRNTWLNGQPSKLIGAIPDDYLVRAARAEGGEV